MVCRHCLSTNTYCSKYIHYGLVAGVQHHYKVTCNNCKQSFFVKPNKEILEKTKNYIWLVSKITKKHLDKLGLTYDPITAKISTIQKETLFT